MLFADMSETKLSDWLTTVEVARLLGLSEARVRQLAGQGRIESQQTHHGRLYDPDSVTRFAAARAGQECQRDASP